MKMFCSVICGFAVAIIMIGIHVDEHTYFIIRIPCHPEFLCDELGMDKDGHILPIAEIREKGKNVFARKFVRNRSYFFIF